MAPSSSDAGEGLTVNGPSSASPPAKKSPADLYQKLGPFLWTRDGYSGWPGTRYRTQWSATEPKCDTHGGMDKRGQPVGAMPTPFRRVTYVEFCEDYGLDPLAGLDEDPTR